MRFEHSFCLLLISGKEFKLKRTVCLCLSILTLFFCFLFFCFKQENIDLGKHKFLCTFFKAMEKNGHLKADILTFIQFCNLLFIFFCSAQSTSLQIQSNIL